MVVTKKHIAVCVGLILASSIGSAQDDGLVGALSGTTAHLAGGLNETLLGPDTTGLLAAGLTDESGLINGLYPGLLAIDANGGLLFGDVTGTSVDELGGLVDATVRQLPAMGDTLVLPGLADPGPDPLVLEQLPGLDALPLPSMVGEWPTTRLPGVETLPLPGLDALPIPVR